MRPLSATYSRQRRAVAKRNEFMARELFHAIGLKSSAKRGSLARSEGLRIDLRTMNTLRDSLRQRASRLPDPRVAAAAICVLLASLASPWAAAQPADPACGNPFVNAYGPLDYRVEQGQKRKIVEDYHFTPRVESLIGGISGSLGAEIDYTLRAFPNHHRALIAMMKLGAKVKNPMPQGAQFTVECYFKRALLFRPDDTIARMIYAKYLAGSGRKPESIAQLDYAGRFAPNDGFTQYNAGLIYFEMGEFDKALQQAHRALELGFEWPGLKQQLQTAGKWVDPPPIEAASAASSVGAAMTPAAPAATASAPLR